MPVVELSIALFFPVFLGGLFGQQVPAERSFVALVPFPRLGAAAAGGLFGWGPRESENVMLAGFVAIPVAVGLGVILALGAFLRARLERRRPLRPLAS